MSRTPQPDRRQFIVLVGGGLLGAAVAIPDLLTAGAHTHHAHSRCPGHAAPGPHPEPRKDYKPDKVLTADDLDGDEELTALFDGVRQLSTVVDGIRCHCGCAEMEGIYSLLSCYEGDNKLKGMATWCPICQGQGRLTLRLARAGKSLEDIRKAVDVRY